jgi:predicted dehydrogenase
VFVEKPLAASVSEAEAMVTLAKEKALKLMVGHTFLYTAAVNKMKDIIDSGELGKIYYVNTQRLNLGLFQQDINVVWDLAPHDISIILYLLGQQPQSVSAVGASHVNPSIEDVAVLTMRFEGELVAFVQSSWLDPDKIRKTTVVGSKKMMVYDDVQPAEKIRIYDKSVEKPKHYDTYAEFPYSYKYGDTLIPKIEGTEPLRTQLKHFLDCINNGQEPLTNGANGLAVVKILEGAQKSLGHGNSWVTID